MMRLGHGSFWAAATSIRGTIAPMLAGFLFKRSVHTNPQRSKNPAYVDSVLAGPQRPGGPIGRIPNEDGRTTTEGGSRC